MEYDYSKNSFARLYGILGLGAAGLFTNTIITYGEPKDLLWSLPLSALVAVESAGDLVTGVHHICSQKAWENTSNLIKKIKNKGDKK